MGKGTEKIVERLPHPTVMPIVRYPNYKKKGRGAIVVEHQCSNHPFAYWKHRPLTLRLYHHTSHV